MPEENEQRKVTQKSMEQAAEQAAAQQLIQSQSRRHRQNKNRDDTLLIDPEQVRKRLKKSLRAAKKVEKHEVKLGCSHTTWVKNPGDTAYCPHHMEEHDITELTGRRGYAHEPQEEHQLLNEKGFEKVWSLVESVINENIVGAYWGNDDEYFVGVSVMHSLIEQIRVKHREWDVDDVPDTDQIVTEVSTNLKAVTSKARNARAMKHTETTVEKKVLAKEDDDNTNQNQGIASLGGLIG